jgi:putative transcriptional regulator
VYVACAYAIEGWQKPTSSFKFGILKALLIKTRKKAMPPIDGHKTNTTETSFSEKIADTLAGSLLVASPDLKDTRFEHTVIYVCGHDEKGAMGLVLNRPLQSFLFKDLIQQLNLDPMDQTPSSLAIYYGGPVEAGRGFVLHSDDVKPYQTQQVGPHLYMTATIEVVDMINRGTGPAQHFITLGYAGWSGGQLEEEILANTWIQVPASLDLIFAQNRSTLWEQALGSVGIDPDLLILEPGHA